MVRSEWVVRMGLFSWSSVSLATLTSSQCSPFTQDYLSIPQAEAHRVDQLAAISCITDYVGLSTGFIVSLSFRLEIFIYS